MTYDRWKTRSDLDDRWDEEPIEYEEEPDELDDVIAEYSGQAAIIEATGLALFIAGWLVVWSSLP